MFMPEKVLKMYINRYPNLLKRVKPTKQEFSYYDETELVATAHQEIEQGTIVINENEITGQGFSFSDTRTDIAESIFVQDQVNLITLVNWRINKSIYQFEKTLIKDLGNVKLNKELPADLLYRIPEHCLHIDLSVLNKTIKEFSGVNYFKEPDKMVKGVFVRIAHNNGKFEPKVPYLLFGLLTEQKGFLDITNGCLPLLKKTIYEISEDLKYFYLKKAVEHKHLYDEDLRPLILKDVEFWHSVYSHLIPIILYLCTENAAIYDTQNKKVRPRSAAPKKVKKGMKIFPADKPKEYRIGNFNATKPLTSNNCSIQSTDRTVSPHVRSAHFHHYWKKTKKGKELTVKWLPPILVNHKSHEEIKPILKKVK